MNHPIKLLEVAKVPDRSPVYASIQDLDLVVVAKDADVSVLYGRCIHRGALLADGHIDGENLICGVHGWDYRIDTGVSEYNNSEALQKFTSKIENGWIWIDKEEIDSFLQKQPQPFKKDEYLGHYADTHP